MSAAEEPVPKLPRGRGLKLSAGAWVRIAMTATLLAMVVVVARPCGNAVGNFITSFGDEGSGSAQTSTPSDPAAGTFERVPPNMTEAELRALVERSKARAAGANESATLDGGAPSD